MAKILVVEDDKLLLKIFKNILEKENHEVTIANNGEDGLFAILQGGFDLILLDIILPIKTGVQILGELKQKTPKKPNGPIVVLSNVDNKTVIKGALELGAVGYIIKDKFNPKFLINEVNSYLKQKDLY